MGVNRQAKRFVMDGEVKRQNGFWSIMLLASTETKKSGIGVSGGTVCPVPDSQWRGGHS